MGNNLCVPCPPGQFKNIWSYQSCQLCPEGTYSNMTGAITCIECEEPLRCPIGSTKPLPLDIFQGKIIQRSESLDLKGDLSDFSNTVEKLKYPVAKIVISCIFLGFVIGITAVICCRPWFSTSLDFLKPCRHMLKDHDIYNLPFDSKRNYFVRLFLWIHTFILIGVIVSGAYVIYSVRYNTDNVNISQQDIFGTYPTNSDLVQHLVVEQIDRSEVSINIILYEFSGYCEPRFVFFKS